MAEESANVGREAPISQEEFQSLAEMIGLDMPEVLADLLETYLTESRSLVDSLLAAHQVGDSDAMMRPVHSLKSSSASVGAMRLSSLCADLEAYLRGAPTEMDVDRQVALIADEFEQVTTALTYEKEQLLNT